MKLLYSHTIFFSHHANLSHHPGPYSYPVGHAPSLVGCYKVMHHVAECHPDFENCKFLHTGVTKDPRRVRQEDEGDVGGSRTRVVFVQATTTHRERKRVFRQLCGFLPVSSWVSVPFVCGAGVISMNCSISVWIILFLVWTRTKWVWTWYPDGVIWNQVWRVNQSIWCEWLPIVHDVPFWYEYKSMV
jgi:hypothetical protein